MRVITFVYVPGKSRHPIVSAAVTVLVYAIIFLFAILPTLYLGLCSVLSIRILPGDASTSQVCAILAVVFSQPC